MSLAIGGLIWRMAIMHMRVTLIWDFLMRRALAETLGKGLAVENSPLRVVDQNVREAYAELIGPLRLFNQKIGHRLSERELFMEIERRFGEEMSRTVCPALGLSAGGCITIAVALMNEKEGE
jgi:hypothetical protein